MGTGAVRRRPRVRRPERIQASSGRQPSPPPGAPAVESAPASLVGFRPELPASVVSASAARGSHWKPEKAIYGTRSTNDIKVRGADGTTIRVNEIYPTTASGLPAKGPFPVLLTMTPYGKGQGGSSSPVQRPQHRGARRPGARTITWLRGDISRSSRTSAGRGLERAAGESSTPFSRRMRSRCSTGPRTWRTPTGGSGPTGRRTWGSTRCSSRGLSVGILR